MVQVNWTDSALQDLNDIGDYIINESCIDILTVHNCARLITNTKPFKRNK